MLCGSLTAESDRKCIKTNGGKGGGGGHGRRGGGEGAGRGAR